MDEFADRLWNVKYIFFNKLKRLRITTLQRKFPISGFLMIPNRKPIDLIGSTWNDLGNNKDIHIKGEKRNTNSNNNNNN